MLLLFCYVCKTLHPEQNKHISWLFNNKEKATHQIRVKRQIGGQWLLSFDRWQVPRGQGPVGIKVRGLAAIRNFPKSRSEAKGAAGRRTQSNRPSWWLGEGQAHPQRMVDLTVLWEAGGLVCRGGEKFKWVVKCEGVRGHLKVRVYGLRSRALSSRELGWVREHGLEPGEKAAEKKLAAALRLCRICDLLLRAGWAWSEGH